MKLRACGRLVSVVVLLVAPAWAAGPPNAPRTTPQLVEYIESLTIAFNPTPEIASHLQAAGIDEPRVDAWLAQLQAPCLRAAAGCAHHQPSSDELRVTGATEGLLELLAAMGTERSYGLLRRLESRGSFLASSARERIAARVSARRFDGPCPVPSDDQLRAAEARLEGFPVISGMGDSASARLLTPAERADLAYFLVAADQLPRLTPAPPTDAGMADFCGTAEVNFQDSRLRTAVLQAETSNHCRQAVLFRLPRVPNDHDTSEDSFGVSRLQRAGFDVPRLYRGALLSVNHGLFDAELRAAITRAPEPERGSMLAYLSRSAHPNWEREALALEGWADLAGRDALPRLVELALAAERDVRERALDAIRQLAARDEQGPGLCNEGTRSSSHQSRTGQVRALDTSASPLTDAEREALARRLAPVADDPAVFVRAAVASTLGSLGGPTARALLLRLAEDPQQTGSICRGETDCAPHFLVREAAGRALASLGAIEATQRCEDRFRQVHPDVEGGHFLSPASQRAPLSPVLAGLLDPAKRDQTLCDLLAAGNSRPGAAPHGLGHTCRINDVRIAPQPDGRAAAVVFTTATWGPRSWIGRPKGPLMIFDAEGFQLPIFGNAFALQAEDDVFSYRSDGSLAFGVLQAVGHGQKTFRVVPVGARQLSLLLVELDGETWTWRLASDGPDQPPRIELGTPGELLRNTPSATWRWSEDKARYEGPSGGPAQHFTRLE